MFQPKPYPKNEIEAYELLLAQLDHLIENDVPLVTNLANTTALLAQFMVHINWVGFYLMENGQLVLGPFQGLPACTRIKVGNGVCGTSVEKKQTQRVVDVHQFHGHIVCDSNSASELVIPLIKDGTVLGVLDIDSPQKGRFTEIDQLYLERGVALLVRKVY